MPVQYDRRPLVLQASTTLGVSTSVTALAVPGKIKNLIVTLNITAAERDSANETYDLYLTTSDGVSSWDVVHFPQVATTGAKRFTAMVQCESVLPQTITTASPGVPVIMSGTMKTDTAGSNEGIKTLAAGLVRHGPLGSTLGFELVVAGTIVTGITFSLQVTPGVN